MKYVIVFVFEVLAPAGALWWMRYLLGDDEIGAGSSMFKYRRLQAQVNQLHRHQTTSYMNDEGTAFVSWSGGCALATCERRTWPIRMSAAQADADSALHCGLLNAALIAAMVTD